MNYIILAAGAIAIQVFVAVFAYTFAHNMALSKPRPLRSAPCAPRSHATHPTSHALGLHHSRAALHRCPLDRTQWHPPTRRHHPHAAGPRYRHRWRTRLLPARPCETPASTRMQLTNLPLDDGIGLRVTRSPFVDTIPFSWNFLNSCRCYRGLTYSLDLTTVRRP